MRRRQVLAAVSLLAGFSTDAAFSARANDEAGWVTYVNARFGTQIDYPATLLDPLPPPDNGDGQVFENEDRTARLVVFGHYNVDGYDLDALRQSDATNGGYDEISYRAQGTSWYVLSGLRGGRVFYRKVRLGPKLEIVHVMDFAYIPEERAMWEPLIGRMQASLSP